MKIEDDGNETAQGKQNEAGDEKLMEPAAKPDEYQLGRDFLTGCLALVIIAVILFVIIPVLIFVLKISFVLVLPVGLLVVLVILTTFFGRIINILRKK
ncbi:MAG: hypothetical protein JRJ12_16915 [Deltaproteobacteria bacterium]|nr:hypothetical protein [Deltaproteobacteria bacterium]